MNPTVLILEDDERRIEEFERIIASLGRFELHIWRNAHRMISQCSPLLQNCCLISLDHDLNADMTSADSGTGLDVCIFLAKQAVTIPVIIHTSNMEARWSMFNELRFNNIKTEIVAPIGSGWIEKSWLPKAKSFICLEPK